MPMSLRARLFHLWMKKRPKSLSATKIIVGAFAVIILLGTLLLNLPAASRSGVSVGFLPALFTATSATCVTGLSLFDTWSQWSGFGQIVLLCLIQIGGLGFMSAATLVIFLLRRNRPEAAAGDGPGPQRQRHGRHRPAAENGSGRQLLHRGRRRAGAHLVFLAPIWLCKSVALGGVPFCFRLLQCGI